MAFYFFDTSAVVKYYVTEPGSAWVRQLIDAWEPDRNPARHVILVAEITRVEVAAGLAIIERVGHILVKIDNEPTTVLSISSLIAMPSGVKSDHPHSRFGPTPERLARISLKMTPSGTTNVSS